MPQPSFQNEENIAALGSFLSIQNIDPDRILFIQEIFRDFCSFTEKAPSSVTPQDFTMYSQLHTHTGDQMAFMSALNLIKSFCQSQSAGETPHPGEENKRTAKATCQFDASPELLEALFAPEFSKEKEKPRNKIRNTVSSSATRPPVSATLSPISATRSPVSASLSPISATRSPVSATLSPVSATRSPVSASLSPVSASRSRVSASLSAISDTATPSPASTDAITANPNLNAISTLNTDDIRPKSGRSISQSFDKFDFSIDKNLAEELAPNGLELSDVKGISQPPRSPSANFERIPSGTTRSIAGTSANSRAVPGRASSGGYHSTQSSSDNNHPAPNNGRYRSESIADELFSESQIAKSDSPNVVPHNNGLLRGVDNIDYDFSRQNIRNIRESQNQSVNGQSQQSSDEPASSVSSWVFDDKYEIDIALPNPQKMQPCKVPLMQRFVIPLTPVIVVLALALAMGSIVPVAGAGFLLIAIVCLMIAMPAMRSPSQETPQSALTSVLNSRNGACLATGLSVTARPTSDAEDPNLAEIWRENAPSPMAALINRFRPVETPKTRIVSGSDGQNSLILLYSDDTQYYLAPMVRVGNKWYIAIPEPKAHKLNN